VIAFIAAGAWVATSLPGHHITGGADPLGPSNPLLKQVAVTPGAWLNNYRQHAVLWLAPIGALVGAALTALLVTVARPGLAFITSALTQAGTVLTAGFALFPFLMPSSSDPSQGLTIWDASSSAKTLLIMLAAACIFLPLIIAYTSWVFGVMRGRVTLEHIRKHGDLY
jgi:cytochrome bd ubiquinol oxidase subunit II